MEAAWSVGACDMALGRSPLYHGNPNSDAFAYECVNKVHAPVYGRALTRVYPDILGCISTNMHPNITFNNMVMTLGAMRAKRCKALCAHIPHLSGDHVSKALSRVDTSDAVDKKSRHTWTYHDMAAVAHQS